MASHIMYSYTSIRRHLVVIYEGLSGKYFRASIFKGRTAEKKWEHIYCLFSCSTGLTLTSKTTPSGCFLTTQTWSQPDRRAQRQTT